MSIFQWRHYIENVKRWMPLFDDHTAILIKTT